MSIANEVSRRIIDLELTEDMIPSSGASIKAFIDAYGDNYHFVLDVGGFKTQAGVEKFGEVMKALMGALLRQPQLVDASTAVKDRGMLQ